MNCSIAHEIPGRIRLRCGRGSFSSGEAPVIEYLLEAQDGVVSVAASPVTGSILVEYEETRKDDRDTRNAILAAVELIDADYLDGESLPVRYKEPGIVKSGFVLLARNLLNRIFPIVVRAATNALRFLPYLANGVKSLVTGKLDVSVLDASAIGISLIFGDFTTAGTIMTLLAFGDILESWTRERSKHKLAEGLAMKESFFWIERDGTEIQIPAEDLQVGDRVVVRAGTMIPVDGTVVRGEATVDQSPMTGEPLAVHRYPGTSVYAGTVIEEGELVIGVTAFDKGTRISRIIHMIDESDDMKAEIQSKAEKLADGIVPYSFLFAGLVFLFTRNFRKATSVLLVDYSCAIKLSTPLAILSAMREGAKHGVIAKGGRTIEKIAQADTVVFDKTGTLTVALPSVADVIPFGRYSRNQILRLSACLEEHFPHSIARAVVRQAEEEGLSHREEHAEVEYVVAHGIVSRVGDERVLIGSGHFVFEDEGIPLDEVLKKRIEALPGQYSFLFLAIGRELAGIICVEDPIREEAIRAIRDLRDEGIGRIVMLTGDGAESAAHVASTFGLDEFHASLLPEQKTDFVKRLGASGARVMMVGDGINDSPALKAADVGVAMKESADIAREVADVLLTGNDLQTVATARRLARRTMRRIHSNYSFIVAVNTALLLLGLSGVITPATSALLHNSSTIGASMRSLKPLLKEKKDDA
ncbi:heavy metal translocating P-type ATPase [Synergistaceae bacterium OttesenSCG-928-I11]|nr:heavy metal translocating P-type ATPase [Synergistaceae bacterium OttesenSCG-928-I11]